MSPESNQTIMVKTKSGEQRCVYVSSSFCCGCYGSCGCHCHHGGRDHCCGGCLDASSSIISAEIRKILNFNQFKACVSDGPTDRPNDGQTDGRINPHTERLPKLSDSSLRPSALSKDNTFAMKVKTRGTSQTRLAIVREVAKLHTQFLISSRHVTWRKCR